MPFVLPPSPPPSLSSAACGIWAQPTDTGLLFKKSEQVEDGTYFLRLGFGARIDSSFPAGEHAGETITPPGGMLFLRLDNGPGWYVTPQATGAERYFDLVLTGLPKGTHRLVAALAMKNADGNWLAFEPYLVRCFTI